ncbi:hypothetical protein BD289DRAFT_435625 [Coniella lustricola]|uniref:Zn(2)-C6 fungal-type domain-containing protein n=1 Tax=Coniella lustricola TaxID=2025994 RepID=A0A2T3A695_9PEZI|nr:hypothetical protein BD289DRAFT_435625 [Coniella lustricola]
MYCICHLLLHPSLDILLCCRCDVSPHPWTVRRAVGHPLNESEPRIALIIVAIPTVIKLIIIYMTMLALAGNQDSESPTTSTPATGNRKKRIACDNCHSSKVRCTGESSGCQRCERGHKICHYSESNMGRIPAGGGVNKRRKPSNIPHIDTALHVFSTTRAAREHQRSVDSTYESIASSTGLLDDQQQLAPLTVLSEDRARSNHVLDDSMNVWNGACDALSQQQQKQQQQQNFKHAIRLENNSSELSNLAFTDPLLSTLDDGIEFSDIAFSEIDDDNGHFETEEYSPLDMGFDRFSVAPSPSCLSEPIAAEDHSQHPVSEQKPAQQLQLQTTQPLNAPVVSITSENCQLDSNFESTSQVADYMSSALSSDSIRYWTTQLQALFSMLQKSPVPLDGTLHQSSQLLPCAIKTLRSLPQFVTDENSSSSAMTIVLLILYCLTQTVTLFESCVPPMLAAGGRLSSTNATSGVSQGHLSLRLGEYHVDRKAQQALQMHIVSRRLSSMLQVSKLIRNTLSRLEYGVNVSKRTYDLLLEDLYVRTVTLVHQMKQARGALKLFM